MIINSLFAPGRLLLSDNRASLPMAAPSSSSSGGLAKISEAGRKHIFKRLAESADPWATTAELQQELALFSGDTAATSTATHSAVTFLDMLHVSRLDVHSHLLNNIKASIISLGKRQTSTHEELLGYGFLARLLTPRRS